MICCRMKGFRAVHADEVSKILMTGSSGFWGSSMTG